MCGDPHAWMCDKCFARYRVHSDVKDGEFVFCAECHKIARHMCFCCDTQTDQLLDGSPCKHCEEDYETYNGPV